MGSIINRLKTFSGALVGLAIMLIALFFVLNWVAQRGWGPVSGVAGWAEQRASGQAYAAAPTPIVGVPSSSYGPQI